jgi:hypothetical protein
MILPVGFGSEEAAGGYQIERSLRFNSTDSAYLNRTPAVAGNRRTWTWSAWVKLGVIGGSYSMFYGDISGTSGAETSIHFDGSARIELYMRGGQDWVTTAVFRDPSAWYHIVWAVDTTQASNTNKQKLYVNGVQITSFSSQKTIDQDFETGINNTQPQYIGSYGAYSFWNGYQTEVHLIDGQQLDASSFGEFNATTGVWQPIEYTGSYGTNGFYLNFSDNASTTTLGDDLSGNGNDWTANGFSVTAGVDNDSLVDTPTNYGEDTGVGGEVRGNYGTYDVLTPIGSAAALAPILNGNLQFKGAGSNYAQRFGNFRVNSGKWYYEWTLVNTGYPSLQCGWHSSSSYPAFGGGGGQATGGSAVGYFTGANLYVTTYAGGFVAAQISSQTWSNGDVIMVAVDFDAGKIWFGKNGSFYSSGNPASGANPIDTWTPSSSLNFAPWFIGYGAATDCYANFGQRPFSYAAPSGFKSLCTQNLPEPTIVDGGEYFNTVLWPGDGSSPRSIPGVGFQPDWVWGKKTTGASYLSHQLYDAVRGVGSGKDLVSDTTQAEGPNSPAFGSVSSLNVDGFTLTAGSSNNDQLNGSGSTYVAWNWKANGAGVTNTDGSITSTVSANPDAGFSIVTYTGNATAGATVGHGLGVAPAMIIVKDRDGTYDWYVYHDALAVTNVLRLSDTSAAYADTQFNQQDPTSSIFYLGNNVASNTSGHRYVAYCFAAIPGYSAMGSYTGTGSTDGSFIYTGFRVAYLLIKSTASGTDWCIYDNKRLGYNVDNNLQRNVAAVQQTDDDIDLLSNGFKFRRASPNFNGSSSTHIYMAFAENPFKYSLAR